MSNATVGHVLSITAAGKLLGVSHNTAYKLVKAGTFPCRLVNMGYKTVVPRSEVERVLGERLDRKEGHNG